MHSKKTKLGGNLFIKAWNANEKNKGKKKIVYKNTKIFDEKQNGKSGGVNKSCKKKWWKWKK